MNLTPRRHLLAQDDANGEAHATVMGLAILLGVTVEEVEEAVRGAIATGPAESPEMPTNFRHLANRRGREGQAATDSSSALQVLMYWARERFGNTASFDYDADARALWMILDDEQPAQPGPDGMNLTQEQVRLAFDPEEPE